MRELLTVEIGQRFGRGVVINPEIRMPLTEGRARWRAKTGPRGVLLLCDCGNEYAAPISNVIRGTVRSCGCLFREQLAERAPRISVTHGLHAHPLYPTWNGMIARCENPQATDYAYYGGRGITVCPQWHDARVFIEWIEANLGPRPEAYSLDRVDNDGNYEPSNVRWASRSEQRSNRREVHGHAH